MESKETAGIRLRSAIIILTLVSLGLVIYTHWSHEIEEKWLSPLLGGLGEAIFIAGALGLTLDRALKAQLVKDVAAEALRSSWGVNAPQGYIENLTTSLASYNRITLTLEVRITLTVHDATLGILRAQVYTRTVTQNISGSPWDTQLPGAVPSVHDGPDSEISEYELTVRNPSTGQRVSTELHRRWDGAELSIAYERTPAGSLNVKNEFDTSEWTFSVKPGGTCEARYTSIVYYRNEDTISLTTSAPAQSWEFLVVTHEALDHLNIRAFIGDKRLELAPTTRGLHGVEGFTHAGAAMQIVWSPESREQDTPPVDAEGQPHTGLLPAGADPGSSRKRRRRLYCKPPYFG